MINGDLNNMDDEKNNYRPILIGISVLLGLWVISSYSFLLFHSIAEIFSIVVACSLFMFAWNSRQFMKNDYFIFIGIAYLFIAFLDLAHLLSYTGLGVFEGYTANLPTQLWIAARYLESLSLLAALLFISRKLKPDLVLFCYSAVTALLFALIFYWRLFPVSFIEGEGLTTFKIASEYIISLLLLFAIALLYKKRDKFEPNVWKLLIASIGVTVFSEMAFTLYSDVYGFSNLTGHLLKIISFYLIYRAVIETGLTQPFAVLLRDLKRSEDKLKEANQNLELQFNVNAEDLQRANSSIREAQRVAGLGFMTWDMKTNEVQWSDEVRRLYAVDKDDPRITIESAIRAVHSDDREYVRDHLDKAMKGEGEFNIDHRILRPDGEVVWVNVQAMLTIDEHGKPKTLVGTVFDITKRRRSEEALRESEARFRTIFESANDGIYIIDPDTMRILDCNQAAASIDGYTIEELKRLRIHNLVTSAEHGAMRAAFEEFAATGEILNRADMHHLRKDGTLVPIEVYSKGVHVGDKYLRVAIVRDITERKKAERRVYEYQQSLKALASQLTIIEEKERSSIAIELHDRVGQSLALARIQLAIVLKSKLKPEIKTLLKDISAALLETNQVARNLVFDLSSPSLNEIGLSAAVSEFLSEQMDKRYGLETEFIDEIEDRHKKVLDNDVRAILFRNVRELLTNVIKHAKAKSVSVRMERVADRVKIVIEDDGVGFDTNKELRLVTPESGFGLFSVKERMADLGGFLEVFSEPRKGCKAVLTMPRSVA